MEKNLYKSIFRGAVILISVALVFSLFYQVPVQAPEKVGISEVVNLIGEGKVSSIEVSGDQLNIQLQDETKLISQKEAGVGITETLVNLGVSPSQLATVKIEAKDESGALFWEVQPKSFYQLQRQDIFQRCSGTQGGQTGA